MGSSNKKEKETFSFSKELEGVTKRVSGEEVENGWVITIHKEWYEINQLNDSKEYKSIVLKYISKDNPLDKLKKDDKKMNSSPDEAGDAMDMLNDITAAQGMLIVD